MIGKLKQSVMVLCALAWIASVAQGTAALPEYKPQLPVSGTIRILGDYHQKAMLKNWEEGFRKYQPNVTFDDELTRACHQTSVLSH